VIKPRICKTVRHMAKKKTAYRVVVGKPERKRFEELGIDGRIILKFHVVLTSNMKQMTFLPT